jgi:predicted nucleic acid-binding protein
VIAIDTSSLSAYLAGERGEDVDLVEESFETGHALLPPVVLSEILSSSRLSLHDAAVLAKLPLLPLLDGYWERAGVLRAKILKRRRKARLADTLIAQSCIDHEVALITRDDDFRHFSTAAGLKLLR